ncbi:glycosyl transferase [Lichenifustis flavocetrariae]|uniref:Glycosyl transferase n=1 Tax=Lichenifustis flavocetrariae TaxID=2949735 RepID=A0AA42CPK3_9HYPH|nr:glycosyl transferase [Lichenifustis flavocetrariae]MCW6510502.1 glycosyl transferase [Lichenifustis flavocetrariae]
MTEIATGANAWLLAWPALLIAAAAISAAAIVVLKPWLLRYALARPSARGLHSVPTPQGGGIAVQLACAVAAGCGALLLNLPQAQSNRLFAVLAAALGLGLLGFVDDIRPLPPLPRLIIQLVLMSVGVAMLPEGTRVFAWMPAELEFGLLVIAGTWFINLTNFMDGMDWITVAEAVPVTACLALFAASGFLPPAGGLLALGLLGGLLGFAPFNRPPARLFLGDVGSLPIGFLLAYALFCLAGNAAAGPGALAAAVILPLYYIADSGITLLRRLQRRERIWEPHRSHFYQVAAQRCGPWPVLVRVLVGNAVLAWLAIMTVIAGNVMVAAIAFVLAVAVVAIVLLTLSIAEGGETVQ